MGKPKRKSYRKKTLQNIADKDGITILLAQHAKSIGGTDVPAAVLSNIDTRDQSGNVPERDGSENVSNDGGGKIDHFGLGTRLLFSQISRIDKSAAVIPEMRRAAPRLVGRNFPSFCRLSLRRPGMPSKSNPTGILRSARNCS